MDGMNWGKLCMAAVAAAIAGSISDWIFFGMIFHDKYMVHPEVWKKRGNGEGGQIAMSSVVGLISSAAFVVLCAGLGAETYHASIKLALAVWLIGPVAVVANEHIFMKLHPSLFFSHSLGWLARFLLAAVAFVLLGK